MAGTGIYKKENGVLKLIASPQKNYDAQILKLEQEFESLSDHDVKTVYIDNVNGDDNNSGSTEAQAIKTFPDMAWLDKHVGGTEYLHYIFLSDYTGNITVPRRGLLVNIEAASGVSVTIHGMFTVAYIPSVILASLSFIANSDSQVVKLQHCKVLVKDCNITNTYSGTNMYKNGILLESVPGGEIRNCNITAKSCIRLNWSTVALRRNSASASSTVTCTGNYAIHAQFSTIYLSSTNPVTFTGQAIGLWNTTTLYSAVVFRDGVQLFSSPKTLDGVSYDNVNSLLDAIITKLSA